MLIYPSSWETFYARSLSNLNPESAATPTATKDDNDDDNNNNDEDTDSDDDNDSDDEDPGTSWFKEHNAPQKVLELLTSDDFPLSPAATQTQAQGQNQNQARDQARKQPSILDLGTGNGSMLALLRRGGFEGKMVGVDYSRGSVELARALHPPPPAGGGGGSPAQGIRFEEWDILNAEPGDWFSEDGFDIVLDKGTFDAISLSDESEGDGNGVKRVCERYPRIAAGLVRKGGFLVVTSCNWTETELKRWFLPPGDAAALEVWGRVEYPVFRFGGMEGQGVCTVCFQRVR